jgi:alginate O-acetyltransferase complex protein AlgI
MSDLLIFVASIGLLTFIAWTAAHTPYYLRLFIAYCLFFTTPVLTYFGLMAPLTGFNSSSTSYYGITFLTPFLALLLVTNSAQICAAPRSFFFVAVNPIYLTCGPIPRSIQLNPRRSLNAIWRRFRVIQNDIIIGIFFISVIAPSFNLPQLKQSIQPIDVLIFGAFFEGYVYFNFAGYSMLAWGLMRLIGIDVVRNFAMPFSATSVVEYWQRWHISLSHVLSELFFKPSKLYLGVYGAAALTFLSSALWHGVTVNFFMWGLLHALCWSCSRLLYQYYHRTWIQISLLIFSIVIGRILFSESDFHILIEKFNTLFNTKEWVDYHLAEIIITSSFKTKFGLFLGGLLVSVEFIFFRKFYSPKYYEYLKKPWVSILLLTCSVLLGVYGDEGAIYGRR